MFGQWEEVVFTTWPSSKKKLIVHTNSSSQHVHAAEISRPVGVGLGLGLVKASFFPTIFPKLGQGLTALVGGASFVSGQASERAMSRFRAASAWVLLRREPCVSEELPTTSHKMSLFLSSRPP